MEFLALSLALAAIVLVLAGTVRTGVPPMPTSPAVRACMFSLIDGLEPRCIHELGAGWGGLAGALARRYPNARVVATEVSPLPWAVCRLRQALFGPANLDVRFGDVMKTDFSEADLAVCFLCPPAMARLAPRLEGSLKPGAHVLSNAFALPGWTPVTEARVDDLHRSAVYLYRK
ncbi:MAG: class I SAM-dependent methyltransferase [Rhodospirillales bacterium]